METITSVEQAGSIIRRIREEKELSRAELAKETGVGTRTLYALETGQAENFGLGKFLRVLSALSLSLSIDEQLEAKTGETAPSVNIPWDDLADIWKLDTGSAK